MFLIVDTDTKAVHAVANPHDEDMHGRCLPLDLLVSEGVDVVVVGGIGAGALDRLSAARIAAYHGPHGTAGEVIDAVVSGALLPVLPEDTCGGRAGPHDGLDCHGHGHGEHGGADTAVQLRLRGGCGA
jgi:predicted Fe-Mo cluster-binding NifX family protein